MGGRVDEFAGRGDPGELGDADAVDEMTKRFASLCSAWDAQRGADTLVRLNKDADPLTAQEV